MPDITTVNDLQGKTEGVAIAAAADGYVGNNAGTSSAVPSANSSYVTYKVNSLIVGNNDASAAAAVTIAFETPNGGSFETFPFVTGVEIPAKASLDVLSSPLYLNDNERLKISTTGAAVDVVASYEQLTTTDV